MSQDLFVPAGFEPPTSLVTEQFRLEPLGPQHNSLDHAAWTSSIQHIRTTPGFVNASWPPEGGMSLEDNLKDLQMHAADFVKRTGFTFTVLEPASGDVIGCLYLYPSKAPEFEVAARSWVCAERAELDEPLAAAVAEWLASAWPWKRIERPGR